MSMNKIMYDYLTIPEKIKAVKYKNSRREFYEKWNSIPSLIDEKTLSEIVSSYGITNGEFQYYLQPFSDVKDIREVPDFLETYRHIVKAFNFNNIQQYNLNTLYIPFVDFAIKKIKNNKETIAYRKIVLEEIEQSFCGELFQLCGKIQALELAKYKKARQNTGQVTLSDFAKDNYGSEGSLNKFFSDYPTLLRLIVQRMQNLTNNLILLFKRISLDKREIKRFLNISRNLALTNIEMNLGDSHSGAQSVIILTFNDSKKLVYKPRDLRICNQFNKLCNWINSIASNSFLSLNYLPSGIYKDEYCYIQYVKKKLLKTKKECMNFYERYGYLIALSYFLRLSDLHLENVIAYGDRPLLVDIETMFQNEVVSMDSAVSKAIYALNNQSVRTACLLPTKLQLSNGEEVELSALSGKETELSSKFLAPVNIDNSNFHFEKVSQGVFHGGENIPVDINNQAINFNSYKSNIVEGFSKFSMFVLEHKKKFLEQIKLFKDYHVRILTKGTERYASMLRFANHPNYNKEMKYRERLMLNIYTYPYKDKRIINSEINDLLFNDVPFFSAVVGETTIYDSNEKGIGNYFEKSGLQLVIDRIESFSVDEYLNQKILLLNSLGLNEEIKSNPIRVNIPMNIDKEIDKEKLLQCAEDIAQEIISHAYVDNLNCTFNKIYRNSNKLLITVANEDFKDGLSGIALFFSSLYLLTNKEIYRSYYSKVMNQAFLLAENSKVEDATTGFLAPFYPLLVASKKGIELPYLAKDYLMQMENRLEEYMVEFDKKECKSTSSLESIVKMINSQVEIWNNQFISTKKVERFNKILFSNEVSDNNTIVSSLNKYNERENSLLRKDNQTLTDSLCNGISRKIFDYFYLYKMTHNVNFKYQAYACLNDMLNRRAILGRFELGLQNNTYQLGLFNGLAGVGLALMYPLSRTNLNPFIFEV